MKKVASLLVILFIVGILSVFLYSSACEEPQCGCGSSAIEWSCVCVGGKLISRTCRYPL